ncbi:MAG: hypothetical protein H3C31_05340 [Brumimicrobium sp.]|nr:hypothetical protein [Brumimicrobium sp.]MCO5268316.1 hypothetical protein [Brumimicrobium sp.]
MKNLKRKLDFKYIGAIVGFILPLITLLILWQWRLPEKTFGLFLYFLKISSDLRDNILIMSMLPSLGVFYFTNFRLRMDRFSMGFVSLTVIYATIITILMLVL